MATARAAGREIAQPVAQQEDASLSAELAAAAGEIQQGAAMERAGIMGSFGARIAYARKHIRKGEVAGMIRALKQEQKAALAALARRTAVVMRSHLLAIRRRHRRGSPPRLH